MVRAKNYETMSTFVKVMQKKLWPLFSRTRCSCCIEVILYFVCGEVVYSNRIE